MRAIRISVVALLAGCSLWFTVAPLRGLFWLHPGSFGCTADLGMRVIDVDSPGPAKRAGIRVGDRFDAATSFENRLYLQAYESGTGAAGRSSLYERERHSDRRTRCRNGQVRCERYL